MTRFDAEQVYGLWQVMVADEAVYDAVLVGEVAALGDRFDAGEQAILRDFGARPGLRWAVENLRYRATMMIVRNLRKRMPATARLLTEGHEGWLYDLAGEYLGRHGWRDLGHRYNSECLRFARFVDRCVAKRRTLTDVCRAALAYESAVLSALVRASEQTEWPVAPAGVGADDFERWCPRRLASAAVAELPVDAIAWIREPAGEPPIVANAAPIAIVAYMISRDDGIRVDRIDAVDTAVLAAADGVRMAPAVVEAAAADSGDADAAAASLYRLRAAGVVL